MNCMLLLTGSFFLRTARVQRASQQFSVKHETTWFFSTETAAMCLGRLFWGPTSLFSLCCFSLACFTPASHPQFRAPTWALRIPTDYAPRFCPARHILFLQRPVASVAWWSEVSAIVLLAASAMCRPVVSLERRSFGQPLLLPPGGQPASLPSS